MVFYEIFEPVDDAVLFTLPFLSLLLRCVEPLQMRHLILLEVFLPDLVILHIFKAALFDVILEVLDLLVGILELLFQRNLIISNRRTNFADLLMIITLNLFRLLQPLPSFIFIFHGLTMVLIDRLLQLLILDL